MGDKEGGNPPRGKQMRGLIFRGDERATDAVNKVFVIKCPNSYDSFESLCCLTNARLIASVFHSRTDTKKKNPELFLMQSDH